MAAPPSPGDLDRMIEAGLAHQRRNALAEARRSYLSVLRHRPEDVRALHLLGLCAQQTRHYETAVTFLKRAVALTPDDAQLHNNLAAAMRESGALEEGLEHCRRAHALSETLIWPLINMGVIHRDRGEIDKALSAFDRALALTPDHADALWERALAKLLKGDLKGGFADYESRLRRHGQQTGIPEPLWRGESLAGRSILLHAEQGLGDTIQYARFAPLLASMGAEVYLRVPEPLVHLLKCMDGVTGVVSKASLDTPPVDFHGLLMSLPYAMGIVDFSEIPSPTNYLRSSASSGVLPASGFTVGVAWAGNPSHRNDRNRSMALADLFPLLATSGYRFVSLQVGKPREQITQLAAEGLILDAGRSFRDFADTADLIAKLDLVVTVDSAPAHLAAAMGKPVWLLLPHAPDWRWMLGRTDSPWYPSMRLYRQPVPGDWKSPVAACATDLVREFRRTD